MTAWQITAHGFANRAMGDSLRKHLKGLGLVLADTRIDFLTRVLGPLFFNEAERMQDRTIAAIVAAQDQGYRSSLASDSAWHDQSGRNGEMMTTVFQDEPTGDTIFASVRLLLESESNRALEAKEHKAILVVAKKLGLDIGCLPVDPRIYLCILSTERVAENAPQNTCPAQFLLSLVLSHSF